MEDFEQLVTRYQDVVCAVAYAVLRDRARSEEVAQDAFLVAWQRLPGLATPPAMPSWLCGIARNLARNAARRRTESPMEVDPAEPRPDARQQLLDREATALAEEALGRLGDREREAVVLFYRAGQSMRQVADALGISEPAARQRAHRARARLRAAVDAVEAGLRRGAPGPAFTAACVAALAARGASAEAATATGGGRGAGAAASHGALVGLALGAAVVAGGIAAARAIGARGDRRDPVAVASAAAPAASAPSGRARPAVTFARAIRLARARAAHAAAAVAGVGAVAVDARHPVSLDFLSIPADRLIPMLGTAMDAPIAIEGDVTLAVNVRMHEVPALEALDEVLAQAGAARRDSPAVLVVARGSTDAAVLGGAPITVDFERAPLDDVLAAIAPALGQPLGAARGVEAEVSIHLDDVPAGAALAEVLRHTGLGYVRATGYVVAPDERSDTDGKSP